MIAVGLEAIALSIVSLGMIDAVAIRPLPISALGFRFSPSTTLCVLCLSAAAGVVPITAGGAAVNLGATAGILLVLGVGKDVAITFSLAPRLLIITSASAAALAGVAFSVATPGHHRRVRRPLHT